MSENFQEADDEADDDASKWTLKYQMEYLKTNSICDTDKLWEEMNDMINKSIISMEPHVYNSMVGQFAQRNSCFEVYGFDVLIDANFKPWLLEVNILPSLSSSSSLDKKVKCTLMADVFTLVGMPYTEEDKPSRKSCKIMEIYKLLGKNYKRKQLNDLEKCNRLNTLNNQIEDNRIDFEMIKKDLDNGVQLLNEDDLDILFDLEEEN